MSQATVTITINKTQQFPHGFNLLGLTPEVHKFVIHKAFICYYSPFFSAAFNGKFEEGNTQNMELDDVDPQVFGILANWLYSQDVSDAEKKTPDLVACAELWVLGDRFLMRKLQNDTIKQIYAILNSAHSRGVPIKFGEFCRIAADTKPEDNPLFKIAVNMLSSNKKTFDKCADEIPYSILLPVSKNLMLCRETVRWSQCKMPSEARWADEGGYFVKELTENEVA
jgi:BTB/POZ domain-containing protein